jgi:predicted DNA-binding transcriptional regulator YafY
MLYQRSLDIERRLEAVLGMIRKGSYSTPRMAEELGVSIPTVSRDVTALRQRGYDIRAERGEDGWRYLLIEETPSRSHRRDGTHGASTSRRSRGHRR